MATSAMARDEHSSADASGTAGPVMVGGDHPAHLASSTQDTAYEGDAYGEDEDHASLKNDLSALYHDSRTYLQAELAFQKSRAKFIGSEAGSIGIYGAAALAFVHLALIALAVGAVLALETLVGPLAATLIVAVVLLVLAGICAYLLRSKIKEMQAALAEKAT